MTCAELQENEQAALTVLRGISCAALRDVTCCVTPHSVVVCGQVPSFYLKQLVQSVLMSRFGRRLRVRNQLTVTTGSGGNE